MKKKDLLVFIGLVVAMVFSLTLPQWAFILWAVILIVAVINWIRNWWKR